MTPAERLAVLLVAQNQLDSAMATQPDYQTTPEEQQ